jgi:hypothetical protein
MRILWFFYGWNGDGKATALVSLLELTVNYCGFLEFLVRFEIVSG